MKYTTLLILTLISITAYTQVESEFDPTLWKIGSTIEINGSGNAKGGEISINNSAGLSMIKLYSSSDVINPEGGYIEIFNKMGQETLVINSNDANDGGRITLRDATGNANMIFNTNFAGSGDSRVITDEIEIKGGSDLAEMFDITSEATAIKPGYLVSLDPDHPGKLMISSTSYDTKVAGIVSGANGIKPGILMGQDNTIADGSDLVTLSGRTYVKANTSNGNIKIGDFITSSDVAGEAMKATKRKRSRGAIIGKAMTSLEDVSGFILVLVNLQ